jgi:CDP-diacylglycerol--glycerol-3-phosphate 3-phosphatidyltransferase
MSSRVQKLIFVLGNVNEQRGVVAKYHVVVAIPARLLAKLGVAPTLLNFLGLVCGISGAAFIATGNFPAAFTLGLISALADAFDGAVARQLGVASDLGNFFDSVIDRYVDVAILIGAFWYFAFLDQKLEAALASLALLGTVVSSYAKARGESLGITGRYVGFMNRPERLLIYLVGLLFPRLLPFLLWPLSVLTNVTALHRIIFYTRILRRRQRSNHTGTKVGPTREPEP